MKKEDSAEKGDGPRTERLKTLPIAADPPNSSNGNKGVQVITVQGGTCRL